MKKLLLIILCVLCITGCSDETPKQEQPPIRQEEKVEEKYLTMELEIEKKIYENDWNHDKLEYDSVKSLEIKNDSQGIFNNITLDELIKTHPGYTYYAYPRILGFINEIAENNDLVMLPDYSIYLDKNSSTSKIIFKPKDEVEVYEDKINLNASIVVKNELVVAVQMQDKCATGYLEYYKDSDPFIFGGAGGDQTINNKLGMYTENTCGINPTQDRIDNINNSKWVKYLGQKYDSRANINVVVISWLRPLDKSLVKQDSYTETSKELVRDAHLFNHGNNETNYDKYNQKEYFILDEQACEEYNLVCDRW